MLFYYFYVTFMVIAPLEFIMAQNSDGGFSYDRIPVRPVVPERNPARPNPIRPEVSRPRRPLPSREGSPYLRRTKPGKKNLERALLMELMGEDYQSSWMSVEKPVRPKVSVPSHEVDLNGLEDERWAQERLFEQARDLNLTAEFSILQPELLPVQDAIRSWLMKRSSCPIQFTWKDLGPTFWPRWVRKGDCIDRKGSCSFPTGMHCVPAATITVHILRWQCRDRKMTIVKKSASESEIPDESIKKMRMLPRHAAVSDTVDDTRQGIRAHERQSKTKSSDETSQRIRALERFRPSNARTSDEESRKRHTGGRQFPKTAEGENYRRRVAETNPEQRKRRRKRCDWYRVPFPITIDCFCTC